MKRVVLGLVALASSVAMGAGFKPEQASCVTNPNDPYDPGAVMHFGKNKGKCVDTGGNRAVVVVSENDEELTIANFRHNDKWWIATIPKHNIETIAFQWIRFQPVIPNSDFAHAQLHFAFDPHRPVVLTSQLKGENESTTITGFVISSTSFTAHDVEIQNLDQFTGQLGMVSLATDFNPVDLTELYEGKPKSREIPLGLDLSERTHLLSVALNRAAKRAYSQTYNAAWSNCNTAAFETLDEAFPPSSRASSVAVGFTTLYDPVIGPATNALTNRGLLAPGEILDVACTSNQTLRMTVDIETGRTFLVKVGFKDGQLETVSANEGDGLNPIEFHLEGGNVEKVTSFARCQAGVDPNTCAIKSDFEEWDQVAQRMIHARGRYTYTPFIILARQVLTKVLSLESSLRDSCSAFGSDVVATAQVKGAGI